MATTLEKIDDPSDKLKGLVLNDVQPLTQSLGRGAFGKVYAVKHCGVTYAAKEIHSILLEDEDTEKLRENFQRECIRCSELTHPNIVRLMGVYYPNRVSLPVMVMELMDENLTKYVEKPNISLKRKISILHDVAEGLTYLHTRNPPVIHRDLSPNNILLKDMPLLPVAKIAGLGVAKGIDIDSWSAMKYLSKAPGILPFMPPEALVDKPKYGLSLDIFSFGGVMLYTVTGQWPKLKAPTEVDSVTCQMKGLNEVGRRKEYVDQLTGEAEVLRPLVEACLDNDPVMRPPISHLSEKIKPLKESLPLVPALQSGYYNIKWEKCADLPSPMHAISAVVHHKNVYIMAGDAPDDDTLYHVYCYNVATDQWEQLPPPGHRHGVLQIIDGKLTVIGGQYITNVHGKNATNKVSTFINNEWTDHFPNLLKARSKPGVVSHLEYVIVAGGIKDDNTIHDDIEVINATQPSQWMMTSVFLPKPMWNAYPTISDSMMYIVGFDISTGRTKASYKLPADIITSSISAQATTDQPAQWMKLPSAPYGYTITIPNTHPPVIMGGHDHQYIPTSDVSILDNSSNSWKKVASLSSPRDSVAVVPIESNTILVLGGCSGGEDVEGAMAHSITTVEKGRATLMHTK